MSIFDIHDKYIEDNSITDQELHSHFPNSAAFDYNDEIRITVEGDRPTLPSISYLQIDGRVVNPDDGKPSATVKFVNNGVAQLFSEIRYELNGVAVDNTTRVGMASTIKGYASYTPGQVNRLQNAGWRPGGSTKVLPYTSDGVFSVILPLFTLLGLCEDYKKIILNIRQELVLIRSTSDDNALFHAADKGKVIIDKIQWKIPHIVGSLQKELGLSKYIEKGTDTHVCFRSWEIHVLKDLPQTTHFSWNIKSTKKSQTPICVIFAFQVGREGKLTSDTSHFDDISAKNISLYLNSAKYPYDNLNLNISKYQLALLYENYARFQESYYGKEPEPMFNLEEFVKKAPIFVVDTSKQAESVAYQTQAINVRVEIETRANIKAETTAYCLLIYERQFVYNALTKYVKTL